MKESKELYMIQIINSLKNALEAGVYPEALQQCGAINEACLKLLLIDVETINTAVKKYIEDQDKILVEIRSIEDSLNSKQNIYIENGKKMYENLLKLIA